MQRVFRRTKRDLQFVLGRIIAKSEVESGVTAAQARGITSMSPRICVQPDAQQVLMERVPDMFKDA
eukprot:11172761-Lingulodinium_polyedra.AAC.1